MAVIRIRFLCVVLFCIHTKTNLCNENNKKYGFEISNSEIKANTTIAFLNSLNSGYKTRLVTEQLRHCPHTEICNFEFEFDNIHWHGSESLCCRGCDCNSSSSWYNLCPDVLPRRYLSPAHSVPDNAEIFCVSTSFALHGLQGAVGITRCPNGSDEQISFKCLQKSIWEGFDTKFTDITPVTSTQSGITYQNKHCAKCSGEARHNLVEWKKRLFCRDYNTFLEVFTAGTFSSICNIIYDPEDIVRANVTQCLISESRCNVTGMWAIYDQFVEDACGKYIAQVVTEDQSVFRNIFCAICNGYPGIKTQCSLTYITPQQHLYDSIFMLLKTQRPLESEHSTSCIQGFIYNKYKDECIKALCSPLMNLVDNMCMPVITIANRFKYVINLRLIPKEPTNYLFAVMAMPIVTSWVLAKMDTEFTLGQRVKAKENIVVIDYNKFQLDNGTDILYIELAVEIDILDNHNPYEVIPILSKWHRGYNTVLDIDRSDFIFYTQIVDYNTTLQTKMRKIIQENYRRPDQCPATYGDGKILFSCSGQWLLKQAWVEKRSELKFVIPILYQRCTQTEDHYEKRGMSVVKLQTCPMVEISKNSFYWEENVYGINFPSINYNLTTADYIYNEINRDSVFVCMDAFFTLQEKSGSSRENVHFLYHILALKSLVEILIDADLLFTFT